MSHYGQGAGQGAGGPKDTFLNYFFGKDGMQPAMPPHSHNANIGRHVSQGSEPTFSQSIRQPETALRSPIQTSAPISKDDDFMFNPTLPRGADFVSSPSDVRVHGSPLLLPPCIVCHLPC